MITLTPETENLLIQRADRLGRDTNSLADTLIAEGLSNGVFEKDPDAFSGAEIADIRAGSARGLEAAAEGRVEPRAQAAAEARQRHGFPSAWASRT